MGKINNSLVIKSVIWVFAEKSGSQIIQFIVQIILARLLLPEDFGIIALVLVFIHLADVFIQSGFATSLIQKKNTDNIDFSTVFYFSLVLALIIYIALFTSAPLISRYFGLPELSSVLRVLGISIFSGVFISVQKAYASKHMMFRLFFVSTLSATLISGVVGVIMAYSGFGVWALVLQQVLNNAANSIVLWLVIKWRPSLVFSLKRMRHLFNFGWKILVSALLDTFERDVRSLIIGRVYSPEVLGYYNHGTSFPMLIVGNINSSIQSVLLPVLSFEQDNKVRMKEMVRRSIKTSTFILTPMMVGLAVIAEPLILLLLTEKWIKAVPFLQIACATFALWPIHTSNLQAITALGRSDLYLRIEIIKKSIGFIILVISVPFGIYSMAWGLFIAGLISTYLNAYPNSKLIGYGFKEQIIDILPAFILSILMGVIISILSIFSMNYILRMFLQVLLGVFLYVSFAILFKMEIFEYLIKVIKKIVVRRESH